MPTEIATETKIVHDKNLGIDRKVIAGQPIPPDLVDAYNGKTTTTTDDDSPQPGYARQPVADLEAEAERRGLTVEGTGADGKVVKADLVQALEADDAYAYKAPAAGEKPAAE